ncbi:hypothetical protein [Luteirhabdus pelagi]|uniref:hypothetical protein n=1 Tax=Luteirhabdus pelagi TaxID=2792783 RepID=UPI00193A788D|nr:hypothetical protein [Luteirhabdus pelagi]
MSQFLRIGAYILHPLLMPIIGTLLYYVVTPRFIEPELEKSKVFVVVILTLLIPLVLFFLLRNLRIISSMHLEDVKERRMPLLLQSILIWVILKTVFDPYDSPELYYFFLGILFSSLTALLLVLFRVKVSLHQMGVAGVTMFLIVLSIHFKVNTLAWISIFFFFNGWVASSRLHTESHSNIELVLGFFIGLIPQLILVNFWL